MHEGPIQTSTIRTGQLLGWQQSGGGAFTLSRFPPPAKHGLQSWLVPCRGLEKRRIPVYGESMEDLETLPKDLCYVR